MAEPKTIEVSRVTVGLVQVVTIVASIAAAFWAVDSRSEGRFAGMGVQISALDKQQFLTTYQVSELKQALAVNLTVSDFTGWTEALRARNPNNDIPTFHK